MATEDDAEWMTGGVSEDPKACLALTWDTSGTPGDQFLLGQVGIAHANVEVQLLGIGRIWPARRNPSGDPLKGQLPEAGPHTYHHPAVNVFVDSHP